MIQINDEKMMSGCGLSGILDKNKQRFSGQDIVDSIALMHDRSNGLGGGFAAYGIYPEHKNDYAFHLFYADLEAKRNVELFLKKHFDIHNSEEIPSRNTENINNPPLIWRYFVNPAPKKMEKTGLSAEEYIIKMVMQINSEITGSFVFSSGKNMGVFKGVGYPEDIADFFKLEKYKAYLWTAHGRFPTNTPGWWGGAHPFTLLNWSIVHNGEISSYGANKRYIEMFGYKCTMKTDTEVITYLFDLLLRKHKLSVETAVRVLAAPLWSEIEHLADREKKIARKIRMVYGSGLLNGPFSLILGHQEGFIALNDRIKLRPLVAAEDNDRVYVASEESAIREICPDPDQVWYPRGGKAVIASIKGGSEL